MFNARFDQYIIGFVPLLLIAVVFITKMDESTDRIAESVEDLTEVVKGNTERGWERDKKIAVLDSKVGMLEHEIKGR